MISNEALLAQMEMKLQQAKTAGSESQLREALSAIRTLCDVVLDIPSSVSSQFNVPQSMIQQATAPVQVQQMQAVQSQQSSTRAGLEEANGSSIFDF